MAVYTRFEAGIAIQPNEVVFTITYPTGGTDYDVILERAFYPHRQAFIDAVNAFFTDESIPLTLAEDYPTAILTLSTGASNFDLEIPDPSQIAAWMGTTPGGTVSNASSVTFDSSTAVLQLADPVYDESYAIRLNRASNFADDGRVGAVLVSRYVVYRCSLFLDNDEHEDWLDFWPWVAQSRKLCLFRLWDTTALATTNYTMTPLHGTGGFKWLHLDGNTPDDLDNPAQEPNVNGHTFSLSGTVYGV